MYAMGKSFDDNRERNFFEIFQSMNEPFASLLFTIPSSFASKQETWIVDEDEEIESFINFLQDYHVRKLNPKDINIDDDTEQFSIILNDEQGNTLKVIVNENLIIQNSTLYYEIIDGPLNDKWLVQFFVQNKL